MPCKLSILYTQYILDTYTPPPPPPPPSLVLGDNSSLFKIPQTHQAHCQNAHSVWDSMLGGPVEKSPCFQMGHMTKDTQIHSSIPQYDVNTVSLKKMSGRYPSGVKVIIFVT
jgi:hypothetical protein